MVVFLVATYSMWYELTAGIELSDCTTLDVASGSDWWSSWIRFPDPLKYFCSAKETIQRMYNFFFASAVITLYSTFNYFGGQYAGGMFLTVVGYFSMNDCIRDLFWRGPFVVFLSLLGPPVSVVLWHQYVKYSDREALKRAKKNLNESLDTLPDPAVFLHWMLGRGSTGHNWRPACDSAMTSIFVLVSTMSASWTFCDGNNCSNLW